MLTSPHNTVYINMRTENIILHEVCKVMKYRYSRQKLMLRYMYSLYLYTAVRAERKEVPGRPGAGQ